MAVAEFNWLYFSGILFAVTVIVVVGVSLVTRRPDEKQITGLSFATQTDEQRRENRASWNAWDVIHTVIILSIVLGIYVFFTFWLR